MASYAIVGIHISDRVKTATDVQNVLTEYGCNIKARFGLHEADNNVCSPSGLIILQMHGDDKTDEIISKLKGIPGIDAKSMNFE